MFQANQGLFFLKVAKTYCGETMRETALLVITTTFVVETSFASHFLLSGGQRDGLTSVKLLVNLLSRMQRLFQFWHKLSGSHQSVLSPDKRVAFLWYHHVDHTYLKRGFDMTSCHLQTQIDYRYLFLIEALEK